MQNLYGVAYICSIIIHKLKIEVMKNETVPVNERLKRQFIADFAPIQEDVHPDLCAVRVDDIPEWKGWVDRWEKWNGHVLQPGTWLFPSGEIVQLTK